MEELQHILPFGFSENDVQDRQERTQVHAPLPFARNLSHFLESPRIA
jgi:hypothetical protein